MQGGTMGGPSFAQRLRASALMVLIAGGAFAFAAFSAAKEVLFLSHAMHAPGVVTNVEWRTSTSRHHTTHSAYAVVQFTANGVPYTFTDSVGSNPPDPPIGAAVDVLYDPAHPGDAQLPHSEFHVALLSGGFGALFAFGAVFAFIRGPRRWGRRRY